MAVESRFSLAKLGASLVPSVRSWKFILFVVLTLLIVIPLYHLRDEADTAYYKQYILEHMHKYLDDGGVYNNTIYGQGTEKLVHATYNFSTPCEGFPNTDGILLVMKTGATEAYDKLPIHLLTHMQCLPDFLLFSDLEQQIGQYHIYDALDRVEETVRKAHKEFDLYEAQLKCPISQKECTANMGGAWDLDKYKFIHMLVRTWEMRPNKEWYVFAEADTYIFWSALSHFLRERAEPKDNLYVGSVAMINNMPFAHGGSGYAISGALVQKIVETIPDVENKYDERAGRECCGDLVISLAADEVGTKVKQAHPMFNGEKPNTLPYGPGHWCEPLFTMHHMNSEEVAAVWQYEETRTNPNFTQIKDMYETFFAPNLIPLREEWSNMSDDTCFIGADDESQNRVGDHEKGRQKPEDQKSPVEKRAHLSPASCAHVCEAAKLDINEEEFNHLETDQEREELIQRKYDERAKDNNDFKKDRQCFQWKYYKGACCTHRSFKLGTPKGVGAEDKYTSGWFVKGINDWIDARGECDGINWREPS